MLIKHINKIKLARRLRTQKEIKNHTPIFQTEGWENRKRLTENKIKCLQKNK